MAVTGIRGLSTWRAVASVAVCLTLAAGVAGCGSEQEGEETGLAAARERVHAWYGDVEDGQVDAVLHAWRNNRDVDRCAATGGYPEWEWRDVISSGWWSDPLSLHGALVEEGDSVHAAELHFLSHPLGVEVTEATPDDITTPENKRLVTDCVNGVAPPSGRGEPEEMIPEDDRRKGAEALHNDWDDVVQGLAQELGVDGLWESDCLEKASADRDLDQAGVEALADELSEEIHGIRSVPDVDERRARIEEFRAREAVVIGAIRECAAPRRAELVDGLLTALAEFETKNAERIARATGYRVRAREIATELGWSPERPQAGFSDVR